LRYRKTLKSSISFTGKGLHKGEDSVITLMPYEGEGYIFNFGDAIFSLDAAEFSGDGRGTILHFPGERDLGTVEHLMSALRGCDVDDIEICVEQGRETPSLDGSSLSYVEAISRAGLIEKQKVVSPMTLSMPVGIDWEDQRCAVMAFPASSFRITYAIDYDNSMIGTKMKNICVDPDSYVNEIAPARTFALESDLDELKRRGLARGGTLHNAILVRENDIVAQGGLRFDDEFVRHKILDILGDLAILNSALCFHVVCLRGGHALHLKLVQKLARIKRTSSGKE